MKQHRSTSLTHIALSLTLAGSSLLGCGSGDDLTASAEAASESAAGHERGRRHGHERRGEGPREDERGSLFPADCQTLPAPGEGRHGPGPLHEVYDGDGSGELDEVELASLHADLIAGCEARKAQLLAAYDVDGDGELSETELETLRAARDAEREAERASDLATYDTNGDGELDREERHAMFDAKRAEFEAGFDADASGELDATELASLYEAIKEAIRNGEGFGRGRR